MEITVIIDVTQEDIDVGDKGKCASCPIARAMTRAVASRPEFAGLAVQAELERLSFLSRTGQSEWFADTPMEAYCFMLDFDAFAPVKPFSFTTTFQKG